MAVTPVKGREKSSTSWSGPWPDRRRSASQDHLPHRRQARRTSCKERELLTRRDEGLPIDKPQTLGEFIEDYLDSRRHEVRALTLAGYKAIAKRYIAAT